MEMQKGYFKSRASATRFLKEASYGLTNELPADWNDFLKQQFTPIMFYYRQKKKEFIAKCEYCGGTTVLENPKSGTLSFCPHCNRTVLLKNAKVTQWIDDKTGVAYLFEKEGMVGERIFFVYKVSKIVNESTLNIDYNIWYAEEERSVLDRESNYIHSAHPVPYYDNNGRWRYGEGRVHGQGWSGYRANGIISGVYPDNLVAIMKRTGFQYSQLLKVCYIFQMIGIRAFDPLVYLMRYVNKPFYELLIKAGLYGLFKFQYEKDGGWYHAYDSKSQMPPKITKKVLQEWGLESKADYKACALYSPLQLYAYGLIKHTWKIQPRERKKAVMFMTAVMERSGSDMKYSFISMQNLFKYWKEQSKKTKAYEAPKNFWSDYTDYISDCSTLKYDVNNTVIHRPKNLKERHDEVNRLIKMQKYRVYDELFAAVYDGVRSLVEFQSGDLIMIAPKTTDEVYEEGRLQNHCVAKYIRRVAMRESIILFLRKKSDRDKPYYTVEIKPDMRSLNICQCRGHDNCEYGENVAKFLEVYTKWFNNRPLGDFNNETKAKYYKSVACTKDHRFISFADSKTEYKVGEVIEVETDCNPDNVAVKGIHMASIEFAERFAGEYRIGSILELEVDVNDVVVPDAEDQVRARRAKVLREVPLTELGEWGKKQIKLRKEKWKSNAA